MKIVSKEAIKDLAGKDIKAPDGVFTVGRALSNILLESKIGGKMKMFVMAQDFFKEKTVEVDDADIVVIKQAVEKTEQYNNLVNGQLLQILEKN